jgi:hypothetical protein
MSILKYRKILLEKENIMLNEQNKKTESLTFKTKEIVTNFEKIIVYVKMVFDENIKLKKKNCRNYSSNILDSKSQYNISSVIKYKFKFPSRQELKISLQKLFINNLILTSRKLKDVTKNFLDSDYSILNNFFSNKKRTLMMKLSRIIYQFFSMKKIFVNERIKSFESSKRKYSFFRKKILKKSRRTKDEKEIMRKKRKNVECLKGY